LDGWVSVYNRGGEGVEVWGRAQPTDDEDEFIGGAEGVVLFDWGCHFEGRKKYMDRNVFGSDAESCKSLVFYSLACNVMRSSNILPTLDTYVSLEAAPSTYGS
jgi:hypothetical protein